MAKLDYFNRSIRGLSYSRRGMLHECAHKFELTSAYRLGTRTNSVTFAFGHAVAMGMQETIAGATFNQAVIAAYMEYDHDLSDEGTKNEKASKKSVHHAVLATEIFHKKFNAGAYPYLNGWEVAKFTDPVSGKVRLGVELTYVLDIVDGFTDEGHIDLVLYHPIKNRYMVVEIKTTGINIVEEAMYKYSDQPLGYGIILDAIAAQSGGTSSFDVLYLIYKSKTKELIPMPFSKTIRDRARWFQELIMDVNKIQEYVELGHFPHNGASCYNYFKPCQHFDICKMNRENLLMLSEQNTEEDSEFAEMVEPTFRFTIEQLLARQDALVAEIAEGKSELQQKDSVDLLLQSLEVTND